MTLESPEHESDDWFPLSIGGGPEHYADLAERRRAKAIEQTTLSGDHGECLDTYVLYRRDDVTTVLRDRETFTLEVVQERYGAVLGRRTMLALEEDEHRPLRAVLAGVLPGPGKASEELAERATDELLRALTSSRTADLVSTFTSVLPVLTLARLLGLPDEAVPSVAEWSKAMVRFAERPIAALRAVRALRRLFTDLLDARRSHPREDAMSMLANGRVSPDDAVSLLLLLVWAGTETTFPALSILIYALLTHLEQWELLRESPSLIPNAVEEGLRWDAPVQLTCRKIAHDTKIRDTHLAAGSLAIAHIGSANRDDASCPDPDVFDVRRAKIDHVSFGYGLHRCLGLNLARAELSVGIRGLLDRFPDLSFEDETPRMLGRVIRIPEHLRVNLCAS